MADGSHVPINEVGIGDFVAAVDPQTGESSEQPVLDVIIGYGSKHMVQIDTDQDLSTAPLEATANHPIWVVGRGWVEAGDVAVGNELVSSDGAVSIVTFTSDLGELDDELVYNLTIGNLHTFVVVTAGGNEILAHNDDLPEACRIGHKLTEEDARKIATKMGFVQIGGRSHGANIYQKGRVFISRDQDKHSGGGWKGASSASKLKSDTTRSGTYCKHMCHRIGK
ncbi:toxin C-terminal domain-containing protein [Kitasatospora sp. NPDC001574]